jgi:hypothetical protein
MFIKKKHETEKDLSFNGNKMKETREENRRKQEGETKRIK